MEKQSVSQQALDFARPSQTRPTSVDVGELVRPFGCRSDSERRHLDLCWNLLASHRGEVGTHQLHVAVKIEDETSLFSVSAKINPVSLLPTLTTLGVLMHPEDLA